MHETISNALGADVLRLLGVLGFFSYVAMYTCLSLRILNSESILYFAGNIVAASLVLISLTQDFNLASALIQIFWIAIGIPAIVLRLAKRRSDKVADETAARKRRARLAAGDGIKAIPENPKAAANRHKPTESVSPEPAAPWIAETATGPATTAKHGYRTGIAG